MTTTDAAKLLGIKAHTLRQQIAKGKLAAARHGRDWYVTKKAVEDYRRDHLRGPK